MRFYLLLFGLLYSVLLYGQQTGTLKGRIISKDDGTPLVGANVIILRTTLGTTTNVNGEFRFQYLSVGTYSLEISLIGYGRKIIEDIVITAGDIKNITIELEPLPVVAQPVVVTASKREQILLEVPASLTVIDETKIFSRHTVTIDQALRHVPGVTVTESQVNIRGASGYTKGVGSRVLVLIDGVPLLAGDTGEIIFESIPTSEIARIEVLKGAGSALYGSHAIGGVINIITNEIANKPQFHLRTYGGFYEHPYYSEWRWSDRKRFFNGIAFSHRRTWDNLGITMSAARSADDGYKQNDAWKRVSLYSKVQYTFSSFDRLTLLFHYLNQGRENFFYWKNLRQALQPPDDQIGNRVNSNRFHLSGNFQKYLSDNLYFTTKSIWFRSRWTDNIGKGSFSTSNFFSVEEQVHWNHGAEHYLIGGVEVNWLLIDANIFRARNGFGCALYVQEEIKLRDALRGTFGLRYDLRRLDNLLIEHQLNPKVGFVFLPTNVTSVRFSVGRGFRTPSAAEAFTKTAVPLPVEPNPQLKAERSWSFEAGARHTVGNTLTFDAAIFRNELSSFIEPSFVEGKIKFFNITSARTQGFEFGTSTNWFDNILFWDVSYTYTHSRDLVEQKPLKFRPSHIFYSSFSLQLKSFQSSLDFRYLSRIDRFDESLESIIADGDSRVPTYVVDLHASYRYCIWDVPMKVTLHVNNLFQYHYVELIGNIAPIRNYVLVLESLF